MLVPLVLVGALFRSLAPTEGQLAMVNAARGCLGDVYDSSPYPGGPPPPGRGACTDVVYHGMMPVVDLQEAINNENGGAGDPELDFRWCPILMQWFERHAQSLPTEVGPLSFWYFRPGDVVFYDDGAGGPGHVGMVSDRYSWDGKPLLIHNPAPACVEENALAGNVIVGHFRFNRE